MDALIVYGSLINKLELKKGGFPWIVHAPWWSEDSNVCFARNLPGGQTRESREPC